VEEQSALTPEIVRFLSTGEGQALLHFASTLPYERLTRLSHLRRYCQPALAAAIVELLELRRRAKQRFSHAEALFFTPEALEQATSETLANWRAFHFPKNTLVLDACCSVGCDTLVLARRGPVIGTDRSLLRLTCAHANLAAVAPKAPATFLCQDVSTLDLARLRRKGVYAVFCDPARRISTLQGTHRLRRLQELSPSLSWLKELKRCFEWGAIKLPPTADLSPLLDERSVVEYVGEIGECSEATLWWGEAIRRFCDQTDCIPPFTCATVLHKTGAASTLLPAPKPPNRHRLTPGCSSPLEWLYEPVPTVIRAGLVEELTCRLSGHLIDPHIAYITSSRQVNTPFARCYRIVHWMPYNLKHVQAHLRQQHWYVTEIKQRGLPFDTLSLLKQLRAATDCTAQPVTLALARVGNRPLALFLTSCDKHG